MNFYYLKEVPDELKEPIAQYEKQRDRADHSAVAKFLSITKIAIEKYSAWFKTYLKCFAGEGKDLSKLFSDNYDHLIVTNHLLNASVNSVPVAENVSRFKSLQEYFSTQGNLTEQVKTLLGRLMTNTKYFGFSLVSLAVTALLYNYRQHYEPEPAFYGRLAASTDVEVRTVETIAKETISSMNEPTGFSFLKAGVLTVGFFAVACFARNIYSGANQSLDKVNQLKMNSQDKADLFVLK